MLEENKLACWVAPERQCWKTSSNYATSGNTWRCPERLLGTCRPGSPGPQATSISRLVTAGKASSPAWPESAAHNYQTTCMTTTHVLKILNVTSFQQVTLTLKTIPSLILITFVSVSAFRISITGKCQWIVNAD